MNKYLEMLKTDFTKDKSEKHKINTDLTDLREKNEVKSVKSVTKTDNFEKYESFDLELEIKRLVNLGIQLVMDDKIYIRNQLDNLDVNLQKQLMKEYKAYWLHSMTKEKAPHCKQNAGRKAANIFLLERIEILNNEL